MWPFVMYAYFVSSSAITEITCIIIESTHSSKGGGKMELPFRYKYFLHSYILIMELVQMMKITFSVRLLY